MFDFNTGNKKQERELKKVVAENQQLYLTVFDNPSGKAVLDDLKKRCYVKTSTYDDNYGRMAFREGRRSIYVHIATILGKDIQEIMEDLTR